MMIFFKYVLVIFTIILFNFLLLNINIYILNSDTNPANYEVTTDNNVMPNEYLLNKLALIQVISYFYENLDFPS